MNVWASQLLSAWILKQITDDEYFVLSELAWELAPNTTWAGLTL